MPDLSVIFQSLMFSYQAGWNKEDQCIHIYVQPIIGVFVILP